MHQDQGPQVAAGSGELEPCESQADGAGDDHTAAALGRMQGSEPGCLQGSRQNTAAFGVSGEGQQAVEEEAPNHGSRRKASLNTGPARSMRTSPMAETGWPRHFSRAKTANRPTAIVSGPT